VKARNAESLKVSLAMLINQGLVGTNLAVVRQREMYKQLIFCYLRKGVIT
jgi:hypothetical protein